MVWGLRSGTWASRFIKQNFWLMEKLLIHGWLLCLTGGRLNAGADTSVLACRLLALVNGGKIM